MNRRPRSLVEIAEDSLRRFPDRPLLGERRDGTWRWITYAELGVAIDEIRGGLAALGVRAGDRVAIVSRNSVAWAAAAYATYGLGATFVPMYESQRVSEWEFIMRDAEASVVFGRTPAILAALDEMRPRLPSLLHVVAESEPLTEPRSLGALRRQGRDHPVDARHPDPETVASFVYTSGTTGRPKGVILTHRNVTSDILGLTEVFPLEADDRTMAFLPWAHTYGQMELHILLCVGGSLALNEDITRLVEDLAEVQPTMLVAVPRIFNRLHQGVLAQIATRPRVIRRLFEAGLAASARQRRGEHLAPSERIVRWLADHLVFEKVRARFGGRLKYAISGSAMLSPQVGEFIDALGIDVYEGYGLTETSPIVAANRPGARRLGSCGPVIPGVTVEIDEAAGGAPGHGEIVVHGPNVMSGYHARPEENAKAFTADHGLRTGDLGYLDRDGFLFITGRIKEQYKLENGEYVMPTPLEEQLALSPFIANVMIHGEHRPYNVALVVLDPARVTAWVAERGLPGDGDVTRLPEVHALIEEELARLSTSFRRYERPRAFVLTTDELTIENGMLTPTLKLKRAKLLERYGDALEALYTREHPAPTREPERPAARIGGPALSPR